MTSLKSRILQSLIIIIIIPVLSIFMYQNITLNQYKFEQDNNYYSTTINNITFIFSDSNFNQKQASHYVSSISKMLNYSNTVFSTDNKNYCLKIGFVDSVIQLNKDMPSYDDLWEVIKHSTLHQ